MRRLLVVIAVAAGLFAGVVDAAPSARAQSTSRAVVIVSTGSGVYRNVIEFSGSISGLEALQLAGASPETITYGPLGQAVCRLYGAGDAPVPGSCPGGWVYYRAVGGAGGWTQSSLGASGTTVHDGDVEGWGYGGAPPFASFCSVVGCAPPATDPPATTPPPTAAPAAGSPTPGVGVAGVTATTGPAGGTTDPAAGSEPGSAPTATTVAPGTAAGARHAGRTLAAGVPATTASGNDGGGSPIGVVVAVVIVAALVGGGVLLRKRRTG